MRLFLEDSNLADAKSRSNSEGASTPTRQLVPAAATKLLYSRQLWAVSSEAPTDLRTCKCSDLGVPAPYGRNIAPTRVYHRRGRLIGESQERVARAKPLPGDEVEQLVELEITP